MYFAITTYCAYSIWYTNIDNVGLNEALQWFVYEDTNINTETTTVAIPMWHLKLDNIFS